MPIRKFRSAADIPPPPHAPLDPENFGRALALSQVAYRLRPWRFPPGVHKHRSVEEMHRQTEAWRSRDS